MLSLKHIALDLPDGAELIRDISLDIPEDRVVVVTGPNGGGKTTLAKLIAGLRQPTAGSISFDGQDITHLDITSRARLGIAYAFQQPVHFKGLRGAGYSGTGGGQAAGGAGVVRLSGTGGFVCQ